MTSDKFGRVRVDQIFVPPRQRSDVGDLSRLADSFGNLEQLQPVVITRWTENELHNLVCGGRRLGAAIARGDEFIDVRFTDEKDPIKLMEMEFAENVHRLDTTWQDKCDTIVRIHEALVARHGRKWTQEQTAQRLGVDQTLVSKYWKITVLDRKGHTELKEQTELSTATTMMSKIIKRAADAHDEEMDELLSGLTGGYEITEKSEIPIITADFAEWVKTYTGPKFNFLHCDFPYGINTDKRNMGNAIAVHGDYDDTFENYQRLLEALCTNLDRICTDAAHIMFWFSMHHYTYTLKFFEEHSNFKIEPHPLIWVKPGTGLPGDYMHGPRRIYETCLFGRRGDCVTVASVANAYVGGTDRSEDHPSPKSYDMLREFFPMFVDGPGNMIRS